VRQRTVIEGESFSITRHRAPWYPRPLYEWKTGRLQDKEQAEYLLSQRVQLDSYTGVFSIIMMMPIVNNNKFKCLDLSGNAEVVLNAIGGICLKPYWGSLKPVA